MPYLASDNELVIRPTRGWFHLDLLELWRYRDLFWLLIHRDFVSKYKQTVLGPTWFIFQPILTTVVFTVVFSGIAKIPTDGLPPLLFYLAGISGWSYFAQTFQSTSGTLIANSALFGKVYFPRLVVPLAAASSNLVALGLQICTLLCFWTYYKAFSAAGASFGFSGTIIFFPLVVLQIMALSLGVGLWLSALTAKYRDLVHLSGFIVQLWMYATPVIYPSSQIPSTWRWVLRLNPMAVPIESMKYMFLGQGSIAPVDLIVSVGCAGILLLSGTLVFSKVEKTFVDTA